MLRGVLREWLADDRITFTMVKVGLAHVQALQIVWTNLENLSAGVMAGMLEQILEARLVRRQVAKHLMERKRMKPREAMRTLAELRADLAVENSPLNPWKES